MEPTIRFKHFTFNRDSGELLNQQSDNGVKKIRLAPQPAKLLLTLIAKYPDVVSHAEIKEAIWPEVEVDFDRSLHYCIRQIRLALNESASQPQFLESIPRRGYRWLVAPERSSVNITQRKISLSNARRDGVRSSESHIVAVAVMLLICWTAIYQWWSPVTTDSASGINQVRIAVMSFQPDDETNVYFGNDIALRLVESLSNGRNERFEVIGPTTTDSYPRGQLRQLIKDYRVDFVLNGKFSAAGDTSRLLAEIIRTTDGAHIWVQYFESSIDFNMISGTITRGLEQALPDD